VSTIREPKTKPIERLKNKLVTTSLLRFRGERVTADGIELELIDTQTGQIALVAISPVNQGECVGCGHVDHVNAQRCEAMRAFTKDPCPCQAVYGRFPQPNDPDSEKLAEYHAGIRLRA
jgi:hypothetical protein